MVPDPRPELKINPRPELTKVNPKNPRPSLKNPGGRQCVRVGGESTYVCCVLAR